MVKYSCCIVYIDCSVRQNHLCVCGKQCWISYTGWGLIFPSTLTPTPSRLPTTAAAAHPNKAAPFLWACGMDERLPRHFQSPTYVDSRAAEGLETPPRTSTSHLASDPKCRPPSAQPRTQLSMATCPGQRTMDWRQLMETATLQPGAHS